MWYAQVRHRAKDGLPAINRSASFPRKSEAQAWAAKIEADWRTMRFGGSPNIPFSDVLMRYLKEVSLKKRSWRYEELAVGRIMQTPLASVRLPALSELHFREWADLRLSQITPASVRREWNFLSNVLTVAHKEWRLIPENFMLRLTKPENSTPRTQRVSDNIADTIAYAAGYSFYDVPDTTTKRVAAAFYFALETAMRAGEIIGLTWDCVFLEQRFVHLPATKNGYPRDVPLSAKAVGILKQLESVRCGRSVFQIRRTSLDSLFRKLKSRGLFEHDVHFHDSRREALTRLAKVYTPMELAKISGHRDLRILLNTYYAPSAQELAAKMDSPPSGRKPE